MTKCFDGLISSVNVEFGARKIKSIEEIFVQILFKSHTVI